MQSIYKTLRVGLLGGAAIVAVAGTAFAADLGAPEYTGMKDDVVTSARKLGISVSAGVMSDYIFRGVSQSAEYPVAFGAVDLTYGMFYLGLSSEGVNFNGKHGHNTTGHDVELDVYGGIKPVWNGITFDFGVISYNYPGMNYVTTGHDMDFVEFKAGASKTVLRDLTLGATVFYSPDASGGIGDMWTVEGTASKPLGKIAIFDVTGSGTVGHAAFDDAASTDYTYWNLGLSAAFSKFTFDVRYWDTDLNKGENGFSNDFLQADERVVGTVKISLP